MAIAERNIGARAQARLELLTGLVVLAALAVGLAFALLGSGRRSAEGYTLHAGFDHVDGLDVGSPVRVAGVTVGQVTAERIDPKTFRAEVSFTVGDTVKLPTDSSAVITSDGLMGGKYIAISPGGATDDLAPGGQVLMTQGSISLEQLLSKFVFSVANSKDAAPKDAAPKDAAGNSGAHP